MQTTQPSRPLKCLKRACASDPAALAVGSIGRFSLQECSPEEAEIVRAALSELWYVKELMSSSERDGGWEGYRTETRAYRDIEAEHAVIDGGRVIGFKLHGEGVSPYVADLYFPIEEEGAYQPADREDAYSFDGGDGEGTSSYDYALMRKDKAAAEFAATHQLLRKRNGQAEYVPVAYDAVRMIDGVAHVEAGGSLISANHVGVEKSIYPFLSYTLERKADR